MLRYKAMLPAYGNPGWVVRDEINQHDIATCRSEKNAKDISIAMNFYNDWILVDKIETTNPCTGCYSNPCICEQLINESKS